MNLLPTMINPPLQAYLSAMFCEGVVEIISDLVMSNAEAVIKAARLGHVGWLKKLLDRPDRSVPPEAVLAAGTNGLVEALKLVLDNLDWTHFYSAVWGVLSIAAKTGDIDVVKFLATKIYGGNQEKWAVLASVISRGDCEMVDVLLNSPQVHWDFAEAVNLAVCEDQGAIVELLNRRFPEVYASRGLPDRLIRYVAATGNTRSVKYLYENGLWDSDSLGKSFADAASRDRCDVLEFLNVVVSTRDFERGFVAGASAGRIEATKCLCAKQRASVEAVNEAFVASQNVVISKVLYDSNVISIASLKTVFRDSSWYRVVIVRDLVTTRVIPAEVLSDGAVNAMNSRNASLIEVFYSKQCYSTDSIINMFQTAIAENSVGVVRVLGDADGIPDAVLTNAFLESVQRRNGFVVKCLLEQKRVCSDVITDAFVTAAQNCQSPVVEWLHDYQHAPGQMLTDFFQRAIAAGRFPIARALLQSPQIAQEIKDAALLSVARRGQSGSMKFIRKNDCWSLEVLKQAHEIATDAQVKRILYSRIEKHIQDIQNQNESLVNIHTVYSQLISQMMKSAGFL